MATKEMTSAEYTKKMYEESPYKDKARDSDMRNKLNAMLNTAGAGRGNQGGPTAKQVGQNRGMMSDAEKGAREEMEFKKLSEPNEDQRYKKGGSVSSASRRADGIASKGKTRGKVI
jgi:hypothetical protein